jgi:ABC-type bacteriocin/lantibiotic exporter with double-glycine peptidase domain
MRRAVALPAFPLLLLLASCAGPWKIDRINHGTPGYTMLRGRVALPRGQHEKTNCGPETVCAALNYLGIAVSIDEAERAVYDPAIKGATSVAILDFARRKGADPEISDDGGLWKLQDHLEVDQPVMIEVTRGGYYHFFLVAGLSRENRTVVFADYDSSQLEMGYDDLIAVWQPARFRSITFTPARAEKLEKQGREFLEGGRYAQAEERFNGR